MAALQCSSPFCLGLGPEWTACCRKNEQPTVLVSGVDGETGETKNQRFHTFLSDDDADKMALGYVPKNTEKSTKWALRNFEEWREVRNQRFPENPIPSNLLTSTNVDCTMLCKWLSHFVAETRNGKGEEYSPASLNQILAGLLRHMRNSNPDTPNFMDKKNTHFKGLHGTLDNLHRKLHEKGKGTKVKHAEVIPRVGV